MREKDFFNQYSKVGILGIGLSGLAVAKKLNQYGMSFLLSDSRPQSEFPELKDMDIGSQMEFGGHSEKLLDVDLLIVSPGISHMIPIIQKAIAKKIPLWSEIEFAYRLTHPETKIIAVTGSNGKSTTASLIAHVLQENNYQTILAGNIGKAYSSFPIDQKIDFIVLEVSSFQLELIHTFKPDVALILNLTPDHLNRYASFDEYVGTKLKIFMNQDSKGLSIMNAEDKKYLSLLNNKAKSILQNFIFFTKEDSEILKGLDLPLKGSHNELNIVAAMLSTAPYIDVKDFFQALSSFHPLEHRLEPVLEEGGVLYINDSKATNTSSVQSALLAFSQPLHLLLGGAEKGEDYKVLAKYMRNKVKKLYLIGESAPKMHALFHKEFSCEIFSSFKNAVQATILNAERGDIVILSPACASFDWFRNYEERGIKFKEIIHTELGKK